MGGRLRLYKIMVKTLTLSYPAWDKLKEKIIEDYGRATVLISWRLRDQLGFTVREHVDYQSGANGGWITGNTIRLDFWDDSMQTMFLLRYADFLNSQAS
jgi:hypothetical protein